MKKKTSTIFTIFASIIYALSIFYFVFNLCSEYKKSAEYTKKKFENSVSLLKENINILEANKSTNPKYANELEKYLDYSFNNNNDNSLLNYTNCSYVEVFLNGTSIYKYLPASLPAQDLSYENESKLIKSFYTSFKISDDNYFVKADIYKLRPYSIYYYSRISFLIILIVTIITIILIIVVNNKKTSQVESTNDKLSIDSQETSSILQDISNPEDSPKNASEIKNEPEKNNTNDLITDSVNDLNTELQDNINNNSNDITSDLSASETLINADTSDNENINEYKEEQIENQIENEAENNTENNTPAELPINEIKPLELENDIPDSAKEMNPEGLFSPVTGLGWEQYLMTRLDSEINRAISSEFDLSLFIIKITELDRNSETVRQVCDYLVSMFQFKDLLFEYKEDCIVAIKISMNIDEAITFADNLLPDINEILKDSFAKCYIGLSSKTIRLISGERLLHEAEEALKHAEDSSDSPIIGFRADAEKFRKFFETKN